MGLDAFRCRKILEASFHKSILQTCNFTDLKLEGISFAGSTIREVYFTNTDLSKADFTDTDLLGTTFHQCNLRSADFRGAKNYFVDLKTNDLRKARFSLPEAMSLLQCFDIVVS